MFKQYKTTPKARLVLDLTPEEVGVLVCALGEYEDAMNRDARLEAERIEIERSQGVALGEGRDHWARFFGLHAQIAAQLRTQVDDRIEEFREIV